MHRILVIAFWLAASASLSAAETQIETLALGASAHDFRLTGVDGKKYTLNDFKKSSILVIVFTCTHCPTAQYYEDRLKKIVSDYQKRSVAVVAINPNDPKSVLFSELGYTDLGDSLADMRIRSKHKKFNFPFLFDGDTEKVSRAYGPIATPHAFVFDQKRKLRYVGRIDDDERGDNIRVHDLRNALDSLLAGRDIEVKQTKSFGCSVKWAGKADTVKHYMEKLAAEPVSLELVDAEGLRALRKNDSGKVRLVTFWATWCGPCITEFPEFVTINRMYRHRPFEMITVAANYPDEQKEVVAFLQKKQSSGKNLIFGDRDKYKLMEAYDAKWGGALPFTMLIGSKGETLYQREGEINPLELKRVIIRALPGYR